MSTSLRWKLPLRADDQGCYIFDADGQMVAEIRGWGHLTGQGGLSLSDEQAMEIQKARGKEIARCVNEVLGARR